MNRSPKRQICLCGCGRSFTPKKNKKFFKAGCEYHYKKQLIACGEKEPDYYTKCGVCDKWFPCYFFKQGSKPPITCGNKKCKTASTQQALASFFLVKNEDKPVAKKKEKPPGYSYKKMQDARKNYCMGLQHNGPQCPKYSICLAPIQCGGFLFVPFFETNGECYEYPEDWNGWRY